MLRVRLLGGSVVEQENHPMRVLWTAAALSAAISLTSVPVANAAATLRDPDVPRMLAAQAVPGLPGMPGATRLPGPFTVLTGVPAVAAGPSVTLPTGLPTSLPTGLPTSLPTNLPTSLPSVPGLSGLPGLLTGLLTTIENLLSSLLGGAGLPLPSLPAVPDGGAADRHGEKPAVKSGAAGTVSPDTIAQLQKAADQLRAAIAASGGTAKNK
jgi:hypothetical protein